MTSLPSLPRPRRRTVAVVTAATLALPLSVAAVAPASAAVARPPVDAPPPALTELTHALAALAALELDGTYGGYGGPGPGSPYPYGGPAGYGTADPSLTSVATATQSAGLVEVTSVLDDGSGEAAGTGMILSSDGVVVTNHHVVAGSSAISVTDVATGRRYTARVLGYDATKDVAVLRLRGASGLTPVATDTSAVSVGDEVTSVGDAGGDGGSLTAAPGTVTRVRTSLTVSDDDGGTSRLTREIEVAADIVPGDSGGALLDTGGAAIGMNVAASQGSSTVVGYVIPVARVLRVAEQVIADDDADR